MNTYQDNLGWLCNNCGENYNICECPEVEEEDPIIKWKCADCKHRWENKHSTGWNDCPKCGSESTYDI